MTLRRRDGFTLIELAIVLVIIGLIAGGVLVGRDLIEAASIRRVIKECDQFETAIMTFKGKYNCLPGDCANATGFFPGAINGDGDGVIRYQSALPGSSGNEGLNVWNHLSQAGMVAGHFSGGDINTDLQAGISAPQSAFYKNSAYLVKNAIAHAIPDLAYFDWSLSYFPLGTRRPDTVWIDLGSIYPADHRFLTLLLTAAQMKMIDEKADDGLPMTGKVGAGSIPWYTDGCYATGWPDFLVYSTPYKNLSTNMPACELMWKIM